MKMQHWVPDHKTCVLYFPVLFFLLFCGPSLADQLAASSSALAEPPLANLSKAELSARGRKESILSIAKFGRYTVIVRSDQGTGLQLIDRMAGPGEIAGVAGEKDGRMDLFLEKGKYKIVTFGHERASGSALLEVHSFLEKNAPQPPALIEFKLNEGVLKDFEQRSYWLEIKERKQVVLEAAGRSLADLRLWANGKWLLDAAPAISTVQPKAGQPLRVCRLTADLEPGLYLLSAYGGVALPWADDSGLSPFYLRYGIPELGSVTRSRFTVSPFGTDRFLAPGSATYFRLELPEAHDADLQVGWFDPTLPFNNTGPRQVITKNSSPPVAELSMSGNKNSKHIITITAEAGAAYVYQHFESNYRYSFQGTGDYWISSIHSGHPQDSIDATAILTAGPDSYKTRPLLAQTIELDQKTGYARQANLLDVLTLFLKINATGRYQILAQGVEARFLVEPFFTHLPQNYAAPHPQPSGFTWDLDAGYYVLTVQPEKKGIMDLVIRPASWTTPKELHKETSNSAVQAAVRFPRVSLDRDSWYTLHLNLQPEVRTGLVLRSLPLDLRDPLPVTQNPGELVSVPIQVVEDGTLRAEAEDGSLMDLSLDNGPWQKTCVTSAGRHTVSIRSTSKDTMNYALRIEPKRLETGTPLPALSEAALAGLPDYPVLTENKPRFFDLERNSASTFLLRADKPDLYQVQTTGLLATNGGLRSRTSPALVRETENGPGRNFYLQQYLREGDYLIAVASKGQSSGHLGLTMSRTGLIEGGYITSRTPARLFLPAGKAAAYHFVITKPGEYRLRAFGLERTVKCRLEDEDGWPVEAPNINADITRTFAKGRYRMIILPETTDARVVTVIEPILRPRHFKGHGPHKLPLAIAVEHQWMEPGPGQKRVPDQWNFELPAAGDVAIELTNEMRAELKKINSDKTSTQVGIIPPARGWTGSLQAGTYQISAVSSRVNNRVSYRVAVRPGPLMDGMSRDISAPSILPIAIGRDGLVEISSFGTVDVKARLMTDDGSLVAANDDRPDDWNFQIVANLKAGMYRLIVDPVGAEQGSCTVSIRVPQEEEKAALTLPTNKKIKLFTSVRIFPLSLPAQGELLTLFAKAPENVGMAVEIADQNGRKTLGTSSGRSARLEIPLREPGTQPLNNRYRLRLWSLDQRATVAELSASLVTPRVFTEDDLKKGIALSRGAAAIRIERKGLLQIPEAVRGLRWSAGLLHPCEEAPDNFLASSGAYVWVAGEGGRAKNAGRLARAERVELGSGEAKAIQFRMPEHEKVICDLATPAKGPIALIASSRTGRPGVDLIEQGDEGPMNINSLAVGEHGSLGVLLNPKKPAARLWSASLVHEPFETRLTQISFKAMDNIPIRTKGDAVAGSIEGVKARAYNLPQGRKRITLSLGEGLAAVLVKNEKIASVLWAEGNPFTETIESDGEQLVLLHTRQVEDRFAIEFIPVSSGLATPPLEIGSSYEKFMLNSGRLRLNIAPGKAPQDSKRTLHVRTSGKDPVFIDQAGAVSEGKDIFIAEQGGTLLIEHGPGAVLSWLDRPGEEAADLWASRNRSGGDSIAPPASIALEGKQRSFRINAGKPVLLHVRSATPLTTYLDRGDNAPEVDVYSTGVVLDAYLPKGVAELRLRAFSGESMSGRVDITSSPVIPTDEGLGPEVLLPPGGSRLYSFIVVRESTIGAGVKADSDNIEMEILNSNAQVVGKGPAQMLRVKPGMYLMKLQAPDSTMPIKVRPALVGLKTPSVDPPQEEIRKYLFPDQEAPLTYTSRRGSVSHRSAPGRTAQPVYEKQDEEAGTEEGASEGAEPQREPENDEGE